jgi:peptide/nickel transport system ATP-binding protein
VSALLSIRNLVVTAGTGAGAEIVKDFSEEVVGGEVAGLVGESGAGKSTIGLAAFGYARPGCRIASGEILLEGQDILRVSPAQRRQLRAGTIAYIAQSAAAAFNPAVRIMSQLTEVPLVRRLMDARSARLRAVDLCTRMGLPDPDAITRKFPHEVSGGQLQRLMTVMALMCRPKILVLDEPTTALDVTTQLGVIFALKQVIAQEKTACLYISHDLAVVAQMATSISVLRNGALVERGATETILRTPREPYTRELLAATAPRPKTRTTPDAGRPAEAAANVVVEAHNIDAGYGSGRGVLVLHDVSLAVTSGRCLGIIGESGSGKSTLARVLAGLLPPKSGEIRSAGALIPHSLAHRSKDQLRRFQLIIQMPELAFNPRMTVGDAIGRPLELYFDMRGAEKRARIEELLGMVELPASMAHRYPAELSGGQRQRANLARALAAKPDLLICDEVTSALDPVVGVNVLRLLETIIASTGTGCIFITHDISKVAALADDIMVMHRGRVVEAGPVDEVLKHPSDPYTRALLASVPELRTDWLHEKEDARPPLTRSQIATVQLSDISVIEQRMRHE